MTEPVKAQVDQSGTPAGNAPVTKIEPKPSSVHTKTFRRTMQHYVTNSNASLTEVGRYTGTTETLPENWTAAVKYQKGWMYIPYEKLQASMTQGDIDGLIAESRRYKILSQGFTIKKISVMQQNINALAAAGTTVRNSFVQTPQLLLYKDTHEELFEATFVDNSIDTQPYWRCVPPNKGFKSIYGTYTTVLDQDSPGASATLPEVSFYFPINAGGTPANIDPDGFNVENGGEIIMLDSGSQFSHTWDNSAGMSWHPTVSLNDPVGSNQETIFLNNTVDLYAQAATQVITNVQNKPMLHLIRVPPLYDVLGPIQLAIELIVEYHCTIEYQPYRFLYSRYAAPTDSIGININSIVSNARSFVPQSKREVVTTAPEADTEVEPAIVKPYNIYSDQSVLVDINQPDLKRKCQKSTSGMFKKPRMPSTESSPSTTH